MSEPRELPENVEECLVSLAVVADAKLLGYERPRCANCRYSLFPKGVPDHGLCRVTKSDSQHLLSIRHYEFCTRWEPRYGVLPESPLMQETETSDPDGDLGDW